MRTSRIIVGAVVATAIVAAAATGAAPVRSWQNPLLIVRSDSARFVAGGLNAHGDALASGTVVVGSRLRVAASSRHGLTGTWSLRAVTGPLTGRTATAGALNDADAAVVAWRVPGRPVQAAARATRTGAWRIATVPSGAAARGSGGYLSPSASITAAGVATLNWVAHEQQAWVVRSAFRSGPRAGWRATAPLVPAVPANSRIVDLTVTGNAAGDAVAAWVIIPDGSATGTVYVALRGAHHPWRAPTAMGSTENTGGIARTPYQPSIAISANGRTAIAWEATVIGLDTVRYTRGLAATGAWEPIQDLSPGATPSIAINSAGAMASVFTTSSAGNIRAGDIVGTVSADGRTWSTQRVLHRFDGLENYDIGHVFLNDAGRAFAWANWHVSGPDYEGFLLTAAANGVWTGGFTGPVVGPPSLASNRAGDTVAIARGTHATFGVSYDAAPRARLIVTARPVWQPGHRILRWTITIANRGARPAGAVHLSASWTPAVFIGARPLGQATTLGRAWSLGTIRVHHSATMTVTIAPKKPFISTVLWGQFSAVGLGTSTFQVIGPT
jgi:hypothetical protein